MQVVWDSANRGFLSWIVLQDFSWTQDSMDLVKKFVWSVNLLFFLLKFKQLSVFWQVTFKEIQKANQLTCDPL